MEITFKNITQELEAQSHDIEQCKKLVLGVIDKDPDQLPDPVALCQALRKTDYFKAEAVYELNDYFQLHELHPIHLLLSLKESPELYSRLYDLYRFQESPLSSLKLYLIDKYKNDPQVTEKQAEIIAYDVVDQYNMEYLLAFTKTSYFITQSDGIKILPEINISLIHYQRIMEINLTKILTSDELPPQKARGIKNQVLFFIEKNIIDYIAIELELLSRIPLYISKQLNQRNFILLKLASIIGDKKVPGYISEKIKNFQKVILQLIPGRIIMPEEPDKINTALKFNLSKERPMDFWNKLYKTYKKSDKNFKDTLLLSNKLDTTDLKSLVRTFNDTHNYFISNPPPIYCVLTFPTETNSWAQPKLQHFMEDFLTKLEINDLAYTAFSYPDNGHTKVEVLIQSVRFEENSFFPVEFLTIHSRGQKALFELENKYGIKHNVQDQVIKEKTQKHIGNYLNGQTPPASPSKKKGQRL